MDDNVLPSHVVWRIEIKLECFTIYLYVG